MINETLIKRFDIATETHPVRSLFLKHSDTSFTDELITLVEDQFHERDWKEVWHYFYYQMNGKKKKRWKKKALKDLAENKMKQPKELLRLSIKLQRTHPDQADQQLSEAIKKIEEWALNNQTFLHEYPFLEDKTKSAIQNALRDDVALIFLNFLKDGFDQGSVNGDLKKEVSEFPANNRMVYDVAVHKAPIKFDGHIEDDNQMKPYKEIEQNKQGLRLYLEQNKSAELFASEFNLDKGIYDLDPFDEEIMASVLSYRTEDFANHLTINVTLGDIVRDVFDTDGKNVYDSVKSRIYKLWLLKYVYFSYDEDEIITANSVPRRGKAYGFFDNVNFETDDDGTIHFEIRINIEIYNSILNKQTLKIYKEQVKMLKPTYRPFLLYMQKVRIEAHREGKDVAELTLDDFLFQIRFKSRSKAKRREEIKAGLDKLIETKVIVLRYTHGLELFRIEFTPMSDEEVANIIGDERIYVGDIIPKTDMKRTKMGQQQLLDNQD